MRSRGNIVLTLLILGGLFAASCNAQTARVPAAVEAGSITAAPTMATQRAAHTATLIPGDRVLIAGGFVNGGGVSTTASTTAKIDAPAASVNDSVRTAAAALAGERRRFRRRWRRSARTHP